MDEGRSTNLLSALELAGIRWLLVVPASGMNPIYRHFESIHQCIYATREEEAVAIAAGMALAHVKPAVIMQQSGVGNCLNAVMTLADAYRIDFPILVSDRGERDENLVQRVSSAGTKRILDTRDSVTVDWSREESISIFLDAVNRHIRWIRYES